MALVDNDEQGSASLFTGRRSCRCAASTSRSRIEELRPLDRQLVEVRGGHDVRWSLTSRPAWRRRSPSRFLVVVGRSWCPTRRRDEGGGDAADDAAPRPPAGGAARRPAGRDDRADPVQDLGLTASSGFRERLAGSARSWPRPLRLDGRFDRPYALGDWVGAVAPGSSTHQTEVLGLAGLVRDRLTLAPAPWPPARGLAVSLALLRTR